MVIKAVEDPYGWRAKWSGRGRRYGDYYPSHQAAIGALILEQPFMLYVDEPNREAPFAHLTNKHGHTFEVDLQGDWS